MATVVAAVVGLVGAGLTFHGPRRAAAAALLGDRPLPAHVTMPDRGPFGAAPTVDPTAPFTGEVSRRILALYDSSETIGDEDAPGGIVHVSPENALAHRLAELPLNHLGLVVDFHDVDAQPLPDDTRMARYRGVLAWFGDQKLRDPDAYLRWLAHQIESGRRVVAMEGLGANEDLRGRPASRELLRRVMSALGATLEDLESDDSSEIRLTQLDPQVIGFEAPPPQKLDYYRRVVAHPSSRVYLRAELALKPNSASDLVFTSSAGGFAAPRTVWREDRLADRWVTRWLIDPFRFFDVAFATTGTPRVDFTTLNGNRIFYSQIDGDGMEMLSELDYTSRCGEIVRDQVFQKYDLPFTASVVVGFTAPPPAGKGSATEVRVARSIFALDNVEVGSHGFAHPLNWRDPNAAEISVTGIPGYQMSGEREIAQSVEYINRELAPPNKPCRIMLWTGACNPSAEQLAVAYRAGVRNLNGGDPRMDAHFPSYAHLVPPVHSVGGLAQYYTSAANDYILTNEWRPPFYRFRNVIQTFERSGAPRRIVPVDVYFHFYSARNATALAGLREVLDWSVAQALAPVFASEYVDIVRDAEWARIARASDGAWIVRKGPSLRTVRFDDPHLHVDVARSRGVLGYLQDESLHATYVHLDDSPVATIRLAATAPAAPYLESATHWVDGLSLGTRAIELTTHGPGTRRFVFAGLEPGSRWRQGDREATVDARGRLIVTPHSTAAVVRIRIERVRS